MTKQVESFLKFENYSVSNFEFKRNYAYDLESKNEIDIEFEIEGSSKFTESKDQAELMVTTKIFEEEFNENSAPFYLEISVIGYIRCEGVDIEGFQMEWQFYYLTLDRLLLVSLHNREYLQLFCHLLMFIMYLNKKGIRGKRKLK